MVERNTALTIALRSYLAGRLGPAKDACRDLLTDHPKDGSAHHLMGLILFSEDQTDEAISHLVTASSLTPDSVEIRTNLGMAFRVAGRPDAAVEQFNRALSLNPDDPAVMGELALSLMDLGRTEEALDTLRAAIVVAPGSATLRNSLGNAYRRLKRHDDAKRELIKALEIAPDMAEAHLNMGILMRDLNDLDDSIGFLTEASKLNPTNAEIAVQLGETLRKAGKSDEAFLCFKEAVAVDPNHAEARNSLGICYLEHDQPEDAEVHLRKAIDLFPKYVEAYANLAACYIDQGEPDKALVACDSALEIDPDDVDSHWHRALALLTKGAYKDGFEAYQWRWMQERFIAQRLPDDAPTWKGEPVDGQTVLVWSEQGFGDALHFARLIGALKAKGATVVFEVRPSLTPVMATLADADAVTVRGEPRPAHDWQVPLMDLPHRLGLTRDRIRTMSEAPYLSAAPDRIDAWEERLTPYEETFRVGICWQGSATNSMDKRRSCPAPLFNRLSEDERVTLFSLQVGAANGKTVPGAVDLSDGLTDFGETAAALAAMDLVVTVDTAVAHLAGALGRPVWLLLAYAPDWRWGLTGKSTPWYPTMTLYRQPHPRDWKAVFTAVAGDLRALVDGDEERLRTESDSDDEEQ